MCRGFVENERETLKIRAFYTHFHLSSSSISSCAKNASVLPDFLTLHFLPRINGSRLEINGSYIRPDTPAFVSLHRVLSEEVGRGFKYGSRERVTVCEGARFEIYVGDVKVMKGIFRKDDGDNWKMECKCVMSVNGVVKGVEDAEVAVAAEGLTGVITEKVEMVAALRRRRRRRCCELEEIPEVREEEGGCCCSECGGGEAVEDGGDCEMEVDVEAVNWAVDVGIWMVCFGVGYLVSASSFKKLRRKRFI
ncbi:hypothetical protein C2S53_019213 [Perilla frutescens var. hirtella]|uniref:Uncharacterized protein n=1 Tax=Perilla frutescens var. hirtella TaxID=608512 RepID=A0AAD4JCU0_PERFH|nr:hypothetical protein C2S53_019213 [Perilla frutescens var. hirtella]